MVSAAARRTSGHACTERAHRSIGPRARRICRVPARPLIEERYELIAVVRTGTAAPAACTYIHNRGGDGGGGVF